MIRPLARIGAALALALALASGCGGSARPSETVRSSFAEDDLRQAERRAPDLLADAQRALEEARRAEARGDSEAASDEATRARILFAAAIAESRRIADEEARLGLEREADQEEEQALRDERARLEVEEETRLAISARSARLAAEQALALAERDEARPARRRRVTLEDPRDLLRAARAIRERARLLAAAARSLGAPAAALAAVEAALEQSRTADHAEDGLHHADRAYGAAQLALAEVRRARGGPSLEETLALAEEARALGLTVLSLEEGLAVEERLAFTRDRLAPSTSGAVEHLCTLIRAHPHGAVRVEVQIGAGRPESAERRAEALRAALAEAGVPAERLSSAGLTGAMQGPEPADHVRVIFLAYDPRPRRAPSAGPAPSP